MKRVRLTEYRKKRFLEALSETGNVTLSIEAAGTSRTRIYDLQNNDWSFAAAWEEAEEIAADRLEAEARRRAVEGVPEPLVSGGKIVRDDDGSPVAVRRYSDVLLIALLRARRPEAFRDQRLIHAGDARHPIHTRDGRGSVDLMKLTSAERNQLRSLLERARARSAGALIEGSARVSGG